MTALYHYPEQAKLKRVVPKSRIYDAVGASTALKERFVHEVDQIIWSYKLAPETVNLPATKAVPELQVFRLALKDRELSNEVLRAIDRAIPFPLIFELEHEGKVQIAAARKRPSEADSDKWVVSDHLRSEWASSDSSRAPLPVALNLRALYEQILTALMPITAAPSEDMDARMERLEALKAKKHEIKQLKTKLKRETQFNIKMTLHGELQEAQAAFEHLKKPE